MRKDDQRRFNLGPSHNGQAAPLANGTIKIRTRGDARDDINGLYVGGNGRDFPRVRRWRLAARATMGTVLLYSALQYHFITMESDSLLPGITVFSWTSNERRAMRELGSWAKPSAASR